MITGANHWVEEPRRLLLMPESKDKELENARPLLEKGEEFPNLVVTIIEYLTQRNCGFILSRNASAGNCRDARHKRVRLGHIGIPLYDELKSIVGVAKDGSGNRKVVAMHCRAHMAIDLDRVSSLSGFPEGINILPEDELLNLFSVRFGTVNPILLEVRSNHNILQVFDSGVLKPLARFPGTMMTNAGDHTWGIEFDPREMVDSIENKIVSDIAVPDTELEEYELPPRVNPKSIGVITGNGPDSGMALWQQINNQVSEILGEHFLGDLSLPKVHIISVPAMGLSMELDQREEAIWRELSEAVRQLKAQKVELLALACHTTHFFTRKIRQLFDGHGQIFISMPDVVIRYIIENKITEFAILGINYVADLDQWSAYSALRNYDVETLGFATIKKFHELAFLVKRMDDRHKGFQQLIGLLKNEVKSRTVIIALTELSILFESQGKKVRQSDRNIIDALDLYAKAIARESLGMTEGDSHSSDPTA